MSLVEIRQYRAPDGKLPFDDWLAQLRDAQARARIAARIDRMQAGLRGDWKSVGAGVCELRVDCGRATGSISHRTAQQWSCCCVAETSGPSNATSRWRMATGRTTGRARTSAPFRASDYLRDENDIAAYLDAILADGDPRLVPVALRTITNAVGGMAALAERTGLSRETLYRTLSEKGNPRLDTLATILEAFGLRIAVAPARKRAIGERC
jgi:probable addiction module antidote protein